MPQPIISNNVTLTGELEEAISRAVGIEEEIITHTPFPSVRYVFFQRSASQVAVAARIDAII